MMLKNLSIKYKILIFPALFTIVILMVTSVFFRANNHSKKLLSSLSNGYVPYRETAIQLRNELDILQRGMQDAVAASDDDKLEETARTYRVIKQYIDSIANNEVGKNNQAAEQVAVKINAYYNLALTVSKAMIRGDFSESVSNNIQKMVSDYNAIKDLLNSIIDDSNIKSSEAFLAAQMNFTNSGRVILGLMGMGLIIFIVISLLISNSLSNSVHFIKEKLNKLSEGNLQVSDDASFANRKDEIGEMVKATDYLVSKLQQIISDVKEGVSFMTNSSKETSQSAESLSSSANEQASSVEEISSTMEEIAANISSNTDNSKETESISIDANKGIKDVEERVNKTVVANKTIMEKITIINDIAFQTNLLALNAAVEAARAGEYGKGFAVVAAEVRKLAEHSKTAAEEIVTLAQDSFNLANQVGELMQDTIQKVENTTRLVQEISAASIEQDSGVAQVNNAIQSMNNNTQQYASTSEQLAGNAQQLSAQAKRLEDIINYFSFNNKK